MNLKEDNILIILRKIFRQRIYVEKCGFGKKLHGNILAAKAGDFLEHIKMFTTENQARSFALKNYNSIVEICINTNKSTLILQLNKKLSMFNIHSNNQTTKGIDIQFTFNLEGKIHSSSFQSQDWKDAELYIRDCVCTLISHKLYQLVMDIKHSAKDSNYSFDMLKKITKLEKYAKDLINQDLKTNAKFITENKNVIIYLVSVTDKKTLSSANELVGFSNRINQVIQNQELLIKALC